MARFEVPEGWTAQSYQFALDPTPTQADALMSHAGGARFAYNAMLAAVKANLDQRAAERSYGITDDDLTPRMSWSFQSLLKFSFTTGAIRVEPGRTHVTLPRLDVIKTHETTRKLARRVEKGTARILKATVRLERGRWLVSFTCIVQRDIGRPSHVKPGPAVVGIDAGVKDLIVIADPCGNEVCRDRAPRELKQARRKLRALQRKAARQVGPWDEIARRKREQSKGWERTQRAIARAHARVANLRRDRLHKLTTLLSQTHDVIGAEALAVQNMMTAGGSRKRGLNRSLADAGLGELFRQLHYKTGWYSSRVINADRWFPSSKLCSGCGAAKTKLHLSERTYECEGCGLKIDRDLNAAVNLARYAQHQTDPSTGVVTGGADRKPSPAGDAGGSETRTRAEVGGNADDGGSASPKGKAA